MDMEKQQSFIIYHIPDCMGGGGGETGGGGGRTSRLPPPNLPGSRLPVLPPPPPKPTRFLTLFIERGCDFNFDQMKGEKREYVKFLNSLLLV